MRVTPTAFLVRTLNALADRIDETAEAADADESNRFIAEALRDEALAIEDMSWEETGEPPPPGMGGAAVL